MQVLVTPIYGWGWFMDGKSIDVPAPFHLQVEKREANPDLVIGSVAQPGHVLDGLRVECSQRHTVSDGYYDVVVQRQANGRLEPIASGYATIP